MTWFAVPDDLMGGWAVADRQAPRSELDTRPCLAARGETSGSRDGELLAIGARCHLSITSAALLDYRTVDRAKEEA